MTNKYSVTGMGIFITLFTLTVFCGHAKSATNYWDNNGATAGFGDAGGTWGSDTKWSSDSTGASIPGTITTTTNDALYFGTDTNGLTAGTINVSGSQGFSNITFGAASGAITLSGGTLNLPAGGTKIIANNSSNTINSVLAGSGGIRCNFGRIDIDRYLTTNTEVIIRNARLSDYQVADIIMDGGSITTRANVLAYHCTNDGTNISFQAQTYDDSFTKCVKVELSQTGANISGRAVYAKYVDGKNTNYDFDSGPSTNNTVATSATELGYGIAHITLAAGKSYDNFLTSTSTNLFSSANLADYTPVCGFLAGTSINGSVPYPADVYHFTNDGVNASYQLQTYEGNFTKCVKVELTQNGTDIFGKASYAKYIWGNKLGIDFDSTGNNGTIATSFTTSAYGVPRTVLMNNDGNNTLTLSGQNRYSGNTVIGNSTLIIGGSGQLGSGNYAGEILNSGTLIYNSSSNQTFSGVISGIGSLKTGAAVSDATIVFSEFLTSNVVTIATNKTLADYVDAYGIMGGAYINEKRPSVSSVYFFSNNTATATFQLQVYDGGYTKCVKLELTQNGTDISGRTVYAKYIGGNNLGIDFDSNGTAYSIATSYTAAGYGAAEITLVPFVYSRLTLRAANTYSGGTILNKGTLLTDTTASALPASGGIEINKGAELHLEVAGLSAENPGGVGNGNPITVNSGGKIVISAKFNTGYSRPITLDGGRILVTIDDTGDNANYMNNLTLKNGAQVIGPPVRVGFNSSAVITVSGSSPSDIDAGLSLVNNGKKLTLNIEDVTTNSTADLTIKGVIKNFNSGFANMPIFKTGEGTLLITATNTYTGPTTLTEGTLELGADNTLDTDNNIILNGGTLDMGNFTNRIGTLTVSTNSIITVGSGELAFADSSAITWSGSLAVNGDLGLQSAHTLRFGTNSTGLTEAQLAVTTVNGEPAALNSEGYLHGPAKGMLLYIR